MRRYTSYQDEVSLLRAFKHQETSAQIDAELLMSMLWHHTLHRTHSGEFRDSPWCLKAGGTANINGALRLKHTEHLNNQTSIGGGKEAGSFIRLQVGVFLGDILANLVVSHTHVFCCCWCFIYLVRYSTQALCHRSQSVDQYHTNRDSHLIRCIEATDIAN